MSIKIRESTIDDLFLAFICSQTRLEALAFHDVSSLSHDNEQLDQIKIPLKKLALHKSSFLGLASNMKFFFDKIAPTLEEIELGRIPPITHIAYEEIFNKCHKLQVLDIFIRCALKTIKFYRKLVPNHSLKELFIQYYDAKNEKVLKSLIVSAPNLETLNIRGDDISKDLLHFISINLPKLKQLFAGLPFGTLAGTNLTSLTTIVDLHNREKYWTQICNAMPNIKTFAFNEGSFRLLLESLGFEDTTIKVVTENWKKLEVINYFEVQLRDIELILKNCADIKSVVVCKFPNDQEASAAIRAIEKNGRRLVNCVSRKESLFFKYHESLWENVEDLDRILFL